MKKVISTIFSVIILGIVAIWLYEYYRMVNDQEPMFCIKEETYKYDDGTVQECVGLGYKVYKYDRTSYKAKQFGPFFIKMHE